MVVASLIVDCAHDGIDTYIQLSSTWLEGYTTLPKRCTHASTRERFLGYTAECCAKHTVSTFILRRNCVELAVVADFSHGECGLTATSTSGAATMALAIGSLRRCIGSIRSSVGQSCKVSQVLMVRHVMQFNFLEASTNPINHEMPRSAGSRRSKSTAAVHDDVETHAGKYLANVMMQQMDRVVVGQHDVKRAIVCRIVDFSLFSDTYGSSANSGAALSVCHVRCQRHIHFV